MSDRKEALVVWNEFQISHFENVYQLLDNPTFIIILTQYNMDLPKCTTLSANNYNFKVILAKEVHLLDELFDIVFFQSPFPNMRRLTKTKLASVQYGLAKEEHNYGVWRSLSDVIFTYGGYSEDILSSYAPSISIGHPRLLNFRRELTEPKQKKNQKKNILFMPTWGELGSSKDVLPVLAKLRSVHDVKFKFHHNDLKVPSRDPFLLAENFGFSTNDILGPDTNTFEHIEQSDLVISDFSGAIFDAVLLKKPVLLFQSDVASKIGKQKFNQSSIEYSRSQEIGYVCEKIEHLSLSIDYILNNSEEVIENAAAIRKELFLLPEFDDGKSKFLQACDELHCGTLCKSQSQIRMAKFVRKHQYAKNADNKQTSKPAKQECYKKKLVKALLYPFLNIRLRRKIIDKPELFFDDSQKFIVRLLGKFSGYSSA